MNKTLIAKLDKVFSEYIRLRDSENGYCKCISCGKVHHWKEMDAGHFVNRKHMSVRYNEKNVNAQCRACNRFDEGNIPSYSLNLIKIHGQGIIEELLWKKSQSTKFTDFEAKIMIDRYKELVSQMKV
jgi:hypothetical protein